MRLFGLMLVSVLVALSVSACGFRPMYGTAAIPSGARVALNDVAISNIPDRSGQQLRNALIDRFYAEGRPADARYRLDIAPIQEIKTELDVTKSADTTRAQLRLRTTMVLVDGLTGQPVLERALSTITSYNVLGSQFSTRVTEQNARDNGLKDLSRQIEQAVVLYMNRTPQQKTPYEAQAVEGVRYKILP
ncbi:LPS assembly lipoprotein LptE [Micavibrio aeruginosavorus]|uniref:LPS-assembly lipoprotein n=1 Tax=Micavibrio aeruginosavorus (strain ARL-13) TaxID=856793 RepID=G2KLF1_MICAA|nr:LPS assembly lipoprotein LptE [Micavibrio aeruginosavorus]AEP08387.1 putative uncharacterized protein [Micavibrio aeruginosavorus ARL-13]